jgi:TonB-linked outer membrane protein, SusC/RagA family
MDLKTNMKRVVMLCIMGITGLLLFAQNRNVSGTVTDASGETMIGVSVMEKGTTNGTITDFNGKYTLSVGNNAVLVFSYIGYAPQDVSVGNRSVVNVTLKEDTKDLDELVVIGYGVQKKSDVTGALSRVTAAELTSLPVTNVMQALQGKAAGVDITSNNRPGELGTIRIRGQRSITASSEPLYVVDGIPLNSGAAIETLNPNDIESIDILKDASATAIYGSKGANGVILVTTKKGSAGKFTLNYSGKMTVENAYTKAPMMNASDYITWRRWADYNAGKSTVPGDQPTQANDETIFSGLDATSKANVMRGWSGGSWNGANVISTDWTDYVTQTGTTQEHTISASGGTEKMSTYVSFGYLDNQGTFKGQSYNRYSTNINVDLNPTKWFKLGASINASMSTQDYGVSTLGAPSSNNPDYIYSWAQYIYSYALPYTADGEYIYNPGGDPNVRNVVDEWEKSQQQRKTVRALGSFNANFDIGEIFDPLKGLSFRLNFGPDFRYWREGVFIDSESVTRRGANNLSRRNDREDNSWTFDQQLNYNRTFGKHAVSGTLLHTATKYVDERSGITAYGIPNPAWKWNAMGVVDITNTATNASISTAINEEQLESYMFRLHYGFNERYLITASGRWDGASQLAAGNKWSFFPSAALAWRIDQEDFLKDIDWLYNLKARVGFGSVGNAAVLRYNTLGTIQSDFYPFNGLDNTIFYTTNEPNYTSSQMEMANKELGWEVTTQYNFGLDFGFIGGRVGGSLDFYTSNTKDLLLVMNIPTLTGYPRTTANIGNTSNKGVELTLNLVPVRTKGFEWNSNISASYTKDKVVELATGKADDIANQLFIGESIGVFYHVDNNGLWQDTPEDLAEMEKFNTSGAGHAFKPGMVRPVDQNGDYKINAEDNIVLGNKNPRWVLGWNNSFSWKGVDLSFQMYGRFKYMINTGGESQLGRYNQRQIDYWTPTNTNAEYQKPIYNESGGDSYSNLLGFRDASFLKMRNISLGYRLPKKVISNLGISNCKIYVQATNPFTIYSSVDFVDLDYTRNSTGRNNTTTVVSSYNRGVTFGLDLTF